MNKVVLERFVKGVTKRYIFAYQHYPKHTLRVYQRQGSTPKMIYDIVSPGSKGDEFGQKSSGISHNNNFLVVGAVGEQNLKHAAYVYRIQETNPTDPFPFVQKLEPILEPGESTLYYGRGTAISINENNVVVIQIFDLYLFHSLFVFNYDYVSNKWTQTQRVPNVYYEEVCCIELTSENLFVVHTDKLLIYKVNNGIVALTKTISEDYGHHDVAMKLSNGTLYVASSNKRIIYRYHQNDGEWEGTNPIVVLPSKSNPDTNDGFARDNSMSIHGNVLVVGAPWFSFDADFGSFNGVVYMFLYNESTDTWEQDKTLRGEEERDALFGRYVVVDKDHVYIGRRGGLYQYKHGY